jgi:F0F1-type ATP synthase membrane subunit b/b'
MRRGNLTVPTNTGERETLERLRADEDALERDLASARSDAAAAVEGARREAERIAAEARRDAERDAERLRVLASEELQRELAGAGAEIASASAELGRRAGANEERAVARALEVVLGRAP